jgi:F0F1-type ATP synthase membrane subunit c/vacuolar-type H+-ATPase subunit K
MLRTQLFLVVAFLDVIAIIGVAVAFIFIFANPLVGQLG